MLARMAKVPLKIPNGVEVIVDRSLVTVKGSLGEITYNFNHVVNFTKDNDQVFITTTEDSNFAKAISGTAKAVLTNMVTGVIQGFHKKLIIIGVGYRCSLQGANLNLALGFSHPVIHIPPQGISLELPTPTEIVVKGISRELVGQQAAVIRNYRPVEPYKGKGIRYEGERVILKETKKK